MRKIIHDCDCTFGIHGCDVDDGLALIYLLGDPDAEVLGVTTTYGNNKIDKVYPAAKKLLKDIGYGDIPVYRGGAFAGETGSEASYYLAEMAEKYAGELELLVTGSVTNLYGAYMHNPKFFEQVKRIVLMGGITEPLIFEKKQMDELNFSCDPLATYTVLTSGTEVSVITGNNCLKVLFTREEYRREFAEDTEGVIDYIKKNTDYWFDDNMNDYGIPGFYNWDVVAAVYLMHPELFSSHRKEFALSVKDLETGFLRECSGTDSKRNCMLDIPEIGEEMPFRQNIYNTWRKADR